MPLVWTIVVPGELRQARAKVFDERGNVVDEIQLPPVFSVDIRADLVRRAFLAAFTARLQPKGRDPMAGRRTSAKSWGVGYGLARVPRQWNGRARFVVSARGGHAAFPPRVDERLEEEINKKERAMAIASALAATSRPELVKARGHVFSVETLPIIIADSAEDAVKSSKDARVFLQRLGIWEDIERSQEGTGIRAGKGKMRGRKYVEPKSVLFVLSDHRKPLGLAVRNMPGVDVATPGTLSIMHLAPGGVPGRLAVFSKSSLEVLAKKFEVIFV